MTILFLTTLEICNFEGVNLLKINRYPNSVYLKEKAGSFDSSFYEPDLKVLPSFRFLGLLFLGLLFLELLFLLGVFIF